MAAKTNNNEGSDERSQRLQQEAGYEKAAKKASATAGEKSYNTSAGGLGAYAAKMAAQKAARATPTATAPTPAPTPTATSLSITTPHDLGGTPISPYAATKKSE